MATPVATLIDAAEEAVENLYPLWVAGTLKTDLGTFWTAANAVFSEATPNDHPCANWIAIGFATQTLMPGSAVPFMSLEAAASQIYRICLLANYLDGEGLITAAQAAALLAAYNAAF